MRMLEKFIEAALPYSHWGATYFEIRLLEYELADSLFGDIISAGGDRALDVGCGLGLACVYLARTFSHVEGTDIDAPGEAFKTDLAPPAVGRELLKAEGILKVALNCGDTLEFLKERENIYDFIFSHFVMEHVPDLPPLCAAIYRALKPGGKTLHIVPNTHDTIIQLLDYNLRPLVELRRQAHAAHKTERTSGRKQGHLFTPMPHSEFISDYRLQFEVNTSEHYLFPMMKAGLKIRDIKPMREHAYGILAEKTVTARPRQS